MQRFFSTFPGSWPGAGLLVLRAAAGGGALTLGLSCLANVVEWRVASSTLGVLAATSGLALLVGVLTPAAGTVVAMTTFLFAMNWVPWPASALFVDKLAAMFLVANSAALVLLGPGAHSVDAYLFGRREIVIPHGSPPS